MRRYKAGDKEKRLMACVLTALMMGGVGTTQAATEISITQDQAGVDPGSASDNIVKIAPNGENIMVTSKTEGAWNQFGGIYGGDSGTSSNTVENNQLIISGGTVKGGVHDMYDSGIFGGHNGGEGLVQNNEVIINGGTVSGGSNDHSGIAGGYSFKGNATGNKLTINGGTVTAGSNIWAKIYGSFSYSGSVTGNTVDISGGTVTGDIYGGYTRFGSAATGNTVNISGGTIDGAIYGGYGASSDNVTDNTLNLSNNVNLSNDLYNFDNVNLKGATLNGSKLSSVNNITAESGENVITNATGTVAKATVNEGAGLSLSAAGLTVTEAINNGTLTLAGGTLGSLTNSGIVKVSSASEIDKLTMGSGSLAADSPLTLTGGGEITGGELSGTFDVSGGTLNVSGDTKGTVTKATVEENAVLSFAAAGLTVTAAENSGTLTLAGSTLASLTNSGAVEVAADSEMKTLNMTDGSLLVHDGKTLSLASGNVASGILGGAGTLEVSGGTLNVSSDTTGTVAKATVKEGAGLLLSAAGLTVTEAINNGELTFAGSTLTRLTNSGAVEVAADSEMETLNMTGGSLTIDEDKTLSLAGGTVSGGSLGGDGALEVSGGTLNVSGDTTGTVAKATVKEGATLSLSAAELTVTEAENEGELSMSGSKMVSLTNDGTLTMTEGSELTSLINRGTASVSGSKLGSATNSGELTVADSTLDSLDSSGTVTVSSASTVGALTMTGGTLAANAELTLKENGTISGGKASGKLNIASGKTLSLTGGTYEMSGVGDLTGEGKLALKDSGTISTTVADGGVFSVTDATQTGNIDNSVAAQGKIDFAGGTLMLTDGEYSLDYATSARKAMENAMAGSSQTTLSFTGDMVGEIAGNEAYVEDLDKAAGDNVQLDLLKVKGISTENLVIGTTDISGTGEDVASGDNDNFTATKGIEHGMGLGSLMIRLNDTSKDAGVVITDGETLTLYGGEADKLVTTNAQSLHVVVGAENLIGDATTTKGTLNLGTAGKDTSLDGTLTVNTDSVLNTSGNVTLADVYVNSGKVNAGGNLSLTKADIEGGMVDVAGSLAMSEDMSLTGGTVSAKGDFSLANATIKDSTVDVGGGLAMSGDMTSTGSTVNAGNGFTLNNTTLTDSKINILGGMLTANNVSLAGANTLTGTANIAKLTGVSGASLKVGTNDKTAKVSVKEADLNGALVFVDPAWNSGENMAELAVGGSEINGRYAVGQNSLLTLGSSDTAAGEAALKSTGLSLSEGGLTAALYLASPVSLATGGAIAINGDWKDDNQPTNVNSGDFTAAANSLLIVDGNEITSSPAVAGVAGTATIDGMAKIYLQNVENATKGTTYHILHGSGVTEETGYEDSNILHATLNNSMLKLVSQKAAGDYDITAELQKTSDVYGSAVIIPNAMDAALNIDGSAADFFNTAANSNTHATKARQAAAINSAAAMGALGGLTHGTYCAATLMTDAFTDHLSRDAHPERAHDLWAVYTHSREDVGGMSLAGGLEADYRQQLNGVTVGSDLYQQGTTTAGIAISYADGSASGYNGIAQTKNDADYYGLSLYGRKDCGSMSYLGDITYLHGNNELTQYNSGQRITADADTDAFSIGFTAQREYKAGKGRLIPYAGLRYMMLGTGNYTDSLGLKHDADDQNIFLLPVGIKYAADIVDPSGWTWRPRVEAGYTWNLGDRDTSETVSYSGAGNAFGYDTLDSGNLVLKLGIQAEKGAATYGLSYEYQNGDTTEANIFRADVKIRF